MHRAGIAYSDWRLMTRWQRLELVVRKEKRDNKVLKKMNESNNLGTMLSMVFTRVMGL